MAEHIIRLLGYTVENAPPDELEIILRALHINVGDSIHTVATLTRRYVGAAKQPFENCKLNRITENNISFEDVRNGIDFVEAWVGCGPLGGYDEGQSLNLQQTVRSSKCAVRSMQIDFTGRIKTEFMLCVKSKIREISFSDIIPAILHIVLHLITSINFSEFVCILADNVEEAERVRSRNNFEPPNQKLLYAMARVKNYAYPNAEQQPIRPPRQLVIR